MQFDPNKMLKDMMSELKEGMSEIKTNSEGIVDKDKLLLFDKDEVFFYKSQVAGIAKESYLFYNADEEEVDNQYKTVVLLKSGHTITLPSYEPLDIFSKLI